MRIKYLASANTSHNTCKLSFANSEIDILQGGHYVLRIPAEIGIFDD
jgi:hypothetical protein